jgi:hypothetical protein
MRLIDAAQSGRRRGRDASGPGVGHPANLGKRGGVAQLLHGLAHRIELEIPGEPPFDQFVHAVGQR